MIDWKPTMNLRVINTPTTSRLQQQWERPRTALGNWIWVQSGELAPCPILDFEWRDIPSVSEHDAEELKPCPHCGGSAKLLFGAKPHYVSVTCRDCGCSTSMGPETDVKARWNRRDTKAQEPD